MYRDNVLRNLKKLKVKSYVEDQGTSIRFSRDVGHSVNPKLRREPDPELGSCAASH